MSINDLIVNGGFETGFLPPWQGYSTIVTSAYRHSGVFSAQMQDGLAVIYQIINGDFSQSMEVIASASKVGALPNPKYR